MARLTQNQWLLIGLVVVVLVLGGVGFYAATRGALTKEGAQFQTGFGVGGPSIYGNPREGKSCQEYCNDYWMGRVGREQGYKQCLKDYCDKGYTCPQVCNAYGEHDCDTTCDIHKSTLGY